MSVNLLYFLFNLKKNKLNVKLILARADIANVCNFSGTHEQYEIIMV